MIPQLVRSRLVRHCFIWTQFAEPPVPQRHLQFSKQTVLAQSKQVTQQEGLKHHFRIHRWCVKAGSAKLRQFLADGAKISQSVVFPKNVVVENQTLGGKVAKKLFLTSFFFSDLWGEETRQLLYVEGCLCLSQYTTRKQLGQLAEPGTCRRFLVIFCCEHYSMLYRP